MADPETPQPNEAAGDPAENLIDQAELDALAAQLQAAASKPAPTPVAPPPPVAAAESSEPVAADAAETAATAEADLAAEMAAAIAAEAAGNAAPVDETPPPAAPVPAGPAAKVAAAAPPGAVAPPPPPERPDGPQILGHKVAVPEDEPTPLEFTELPAAGAATAVHSLELLDDVELDVKIELGRTTMYVEDVLRLNAGSVVELDKLAGDPVDVYVNERLVARGEVLVLNDNFCVRINEIVSPNPEEAEATA